MIVMGSSNRSRVQTAALYTMATGFGLGAVGFALTGHFKEAAEGGALALGALACAGLSQTKDALVAAGSLAAPNHNGN